MKLQFSETSNAIKDLREHFSQISDGNIVAIFYMIVCEICTYTCLEKVLTWLQAKNPEVLYRKNQDQLLEGTCEWITEDPTYQAWIGGKGTRNMWIVGIPGIIKIHIGNVTKFSKLTHGIKQALGSLFCQPAL